MAAKRKPVFEVRPSPLEEGLWFYRERMAGDIKNTSDNYVSKFNATRAARREAAIEGAVVRIFHRDGHTFTEERPTPLL